MMRYFGTLYLAFCEDLEQVPVPLTATCQWCSEPFLKDESGIEYANHGVYAHIGCFLRQTIGSIAHQQHRCRCYGFTPEPSTLSVREEANQAVAYFYAQRLPTIH